MRQVSGEPLEAGWVVHSKTGEPILDPNKVHEGVLLPIGGHKGSGLALMIGLLAGVLNGAAFGRDVIESQQHGSDPTNTGQFVVALDVSRFIKPELFAAEMDRHLNDLRSSPTLPGFDRIRTPGRGPPASAAPTAPRTAWSCRRKVVKQLDDMAASLKITPLAGASRLKRRNASFQLRVVARRPRRAPAAAPRAAALRPPSASCPGGRAGRTGC